MAILAPMATTSSDLHSGRGHPSGMSLGDVILRRFDRREDLFVVDPPGCKAWEIKLDRDLSWLIPVNP